MSLVDWSVALPGVNDDCPVSEAKARVQCDSPALFIDPGATHPDRRIANLTQRLAKLDQAEAKAANGSLQPLVGQAAKVQAECALDDDMPECIHEVVAEELRKQSLSEISFRPGLVAVSREGRATIQSIAEILRKHPRACIKVSSYTSKPSAQWPTAEACTRLALERAKLVRSMLVEAGCVCEICTLALGNVDERGSRCQVQACQRSEICGLREDETSAATEEEDSGLRVVFRRPAGDPEVVIFHRAPMGLTFSRLMPAVVIDVEPGGAAEALGVQVGWHFHQVGHASVEAADFHTLKRLLSDGLERLPRDCNTSCGH